MSDLQWITEPPIRVLKVGEIATVLEAMREAMKGWDAVAVPDKPAPPYALPGRGQKPEDVRQAQLKRVAPDIDSSDWKRPMRTFQERWNDRISSTNTMLKKDYDTGQTFGYFVAGVAVGVMELFAGSAPIYVANLVCHPGADQAGGIMIEYAVNYGQKNLSDPRLELHALNEDARQAYLALGFFSVAPEGASMYLDPKNCNKWTQLSDGWHLTKYAKPQTYLA